MDACESRFREYLEKHNVRCLFASYTGSIATGLQSAAVSDSNASAVGADLAL